MTLSDAQYAYLRSELGEAERTDLDTGYQRLGSLPAVAAEVLRERKATLVSDPLAVTVQGVAAVNNAENVKALERQIAGLEGAGQRRRDPISDFVGASPNALTVESSEIMPICGIDFGAGKTPHYRSESACYPTKMRYSEE